MSTAYVHFGKPITPDTASILLGGCKSIVSENDGKGTRKWRILHLCISSPGGDITSAFGAYTELKALDVELICHNIGAIDSAAIMLMMAAKRRFASAASAFFFHPTAWTFGTQGQVPSPHVVGVTNWIKTYDDMTAEIVERETKIPQQEVRRMRLENTSVPASAALKMGLIHKIEELAIPWNARSHVV